MILKKMKIFFFTYFLVSQMIEAVIFKPTNIKCEPYNKTLVNVKECRLRVLGRDRVGIYIMLELQRLKSVVLHARLLKKANGYKPFLVNLNLDACEYVTRRNNPIANIIYDLFKEFSNINHPCPYEGKVFIQGFYPKPEMFKLPLPTGDYLLSLNFTLNNLKNSNFVVNTYFQFVENLI